MLSVYLIESLAINRDDVKRLIAPDDFIFTGVILKNHETKGLQHIATRHFHDTQTRLKGKPLTSVGFKNLLNRNLLASLSLENDSSEVQEAIYSILPNELRESTPVYQWKYEGFSEGNAVQLGRNPNDTVKPLLTYWICNGVKDALVIIYSGQVYEPDNNYDNVSPPRKARNIITAYMCPMEKFNYLKDEIFILPK